jgi:signal peptidase II
MQQSPYPARNGHLAGKVALTVVAADAVSKSVALWALADAPKRFPGDTWENSLVSSAGSWLGSGAAPTMAALDVVVLVILAGLVRYSSNPQWAFAAGLAGGAAASDLIDRVARPPGPLRGALIHWIETPWLPSFNLADVAYAGAALLAVSLLRPPSTT